MRDLLERGYNAQFKVVTGAAAARQSYGDQYFPQLRGGPGPATGISADPINVRIEFGSSWWQ
jgi:hypothetical protein